MQPQPGMAVATASPATTQMQVACPPGSKPGDPIMIQAPGGVQCQVVVERPEAEQLRDRPGRGPFRIWVPFFASAFERQLTRHSTAES